MIKNYIKIAWRNIIRSKSYAFLNIAGLAVGLAASMLILAWVRYERSYDRFHKDGQDIYRLLSKLDGEDFTAAVAPPPLLPLLKARLAEVADFTRITIPRTHHFQYNEKRFEEKAVFYADSNFFDLFSFSMTAGDTQNLLRRPDGIVLTERAAKKYFDQENPIGKVLRMDNDRPLTVTAVMADVPTNSHLQIDFVIPFAFLDKNNYLYPGDSPDDWADFKHYCYIQFHPNTATDPQKRQELEGQINHFYRAHTNSALQKTAFQLQPLHDIHLHSQNLQLDVASQGNHQYVDTMFYVAFFILLVACINFMNLATARSARRAKEVGLRKVVGADRAQLVVQFLGEALLIAYISFLLSIVLAWIAIPLFNQLAGNKLDKSLFNPSFLLFAFAITTVSGLLAGIYPALYLSGFAPVKVLKGTLADVRSGNSLFRNTLVVIQFAISITLLVGTFLAYQQLNYLKNRDLGFDKSGLLYIPMVGNIWGQQQAYKNALREHPLTADFTVIDNIPANLLSGTIDYDFDGKDPNSSLILPMMDVDEHFFDVFDMQMVAGRSFSHKFGSDSSHYVVNETLAKVMGFSAEEAIGKTFSLWSKKGTIIGVVKDFNFKPATQAIEPLVLRYNNWGGMVVVKTQLSQLEATINTLQDIHTKFNPHFPFSYGFVDQDLEKLYYGEQRLSNLFNFFAVLAIFVSCLGLYGLSSFIAERRAKEIGIRKILGSSRSGIFYLLSKSFLILVAIAITFAIPISWYAGNAWLDSFAYRIDIHWSLFLLAAGVAISTALLTTSFQAWKAARANPVNTLRDE